MLSLVLLSTTTKKVRKLLLPDFVAEDNVHYANTQTTKHFPSISTAITFSMQVLPYITTSILALHPPTHLPILLHTPQQHTKGKTFIYLLSRSTISSLSYTHTSRPEAQASSRRSIVLIYTQHSHASTSYYPRARSPRHPGLFRDLETRIIRLDRVLCFVVSSLCYTVQSYKVCKSVLFRCVPEFRG